MHTTDHTPNPLENPQANINIAINVRWRYFRSIGGTMALACFDSAPIEDNPYFLEIDEIEYKHLCKELKS
jgi:hypothetical protein